MTSSSFNDAGRRHELRTVRGLPVRGAKLPNAAWTTMLCLVGSQSIPTPPVKTVFKAPEHLIQAASGRFRARLEGCVLRRLFVVLCRHQKNVRSDKNGSYRSLKPHKRQNYPRHRKKHSERTKFHPTCHGNCDCETQRALTQDELQKEQSKKREVNRINANYDKVEKPTRKCHKRRQKSFTKRKRKRV